MYFIKRCALFTFVIFLLFGICCKSKDGLSIVELAEPTLDFVDRDFDDFLNHFCPKKLQKKFIKFYNDSVEKVNRLKGKKRRKRFYLSTKMLGFSALEVKQKELFNQLKSVGIKRIEDVFQRKVPMLNVFLFRYGMYQKYSDNRAYKHKSAWFKTKSYFGEMKGKVRRGINSFKGLIKSQA